MDPLYLVALVCPIGMGLMMFMMMKMMNVKMANPKKEGHEHMEAEHAKNDKGV